MTEHYVDFADMQIIKAMGDDECQVRKWGQNGFPLKRIDRKEKKKKPHSMLNNL